MKSTRKRNRLLHPRDKVATAFANRVIEATVNIPVLFQPYFLFLRLIGAFASTSFVQTRQLCEVDHSPWNYGRKLLMQYNVKR